MNKYIRREQRKQQIEDAIAIKTLESKGPQSMRQIARAIDMSPSKHVMSILWDMVDDGRLVANPREHRPGWTAWDFQLPPHRIAHAIGMAYEVQK